MISGKCTRAVISKSGTSNLTSLNKRQDNILYYFRSWLFAWSTLTRNELVNENRKSHTHIQVWKCVFWNKRFLKTALLNFYFLNIGICSFNIILYFINCKMVTKIKNYAGCYTDSPIFQYAWHSHNCYIRYDR